MLQRLILEDTGLRVHVSDLTETLNWETVVTRGLEDRVALLDTKRAKDLGAAAAKALFAPYMASFFAQAPVKNLSHLTGVTQIWTSVSNETPILRFILDGSGLTLVAIDRFEIHLGLRLTQPKWGRDVYAH
jgi:hypothetical protein